MTTGNGVLASIVAVIAALAPLVRVYIQHKVTPDQLARVSDIAGGAVRAAEEIAQHFKGENPELWHEFETWGEAKADYAASVITAGAKRLGVRLKDDEVQAFLHAALRKMEQVAASGATAG